MVTIWYQPRSELYTYPLELYEETVDDKMLTTNTEKVGNGYFGGIIMDLSPILKQKYQLADSYTQELFDNLVAKSSIYCISHSPIDIKEYHYRLQKNYVNARGRKHQNFCLFTLTPSKKGITVHLRTEETILSSERLKIDYIGKCSYLTGSGWVKFDVRNKEDITEAIALIKEIYTI